MFREAWAGPGAGLSTRKEGVAQEGEEGGASGPAWARRKKERASFSLDLG